MKLQVKHPLDLPADLKEWWSVEVSWDSQDKCHLFSTLESANAYAQQRVEKLVKARANSKTYLPLAVSWEDTPAHCVKRALLGVLLLGTPVWDYSVAVFRYHRENGRFVRGD